MGRDFSHIFGWFTAVALAAAFLFFLFRTGFEAALCSSPTDTHCLRDWVSALGGWIGGLATVATLFYLAQQVGHAEDIQKKAAQQRLFELQHLGMRASHAATLAGASLRDLFEVVKGCEPGTFAQTYKNIGRLNQANRDVLELFMDPAFDDIERLFFLQGLSIRRIRYSFTRVGERLDVAGGLHFHDAVTALQNERMTAMNQEYELRYLGLVNAVSESLVERRSVHL